MTRDQANALWDEQNQPATADELAEAESGAEDDADAEFANSGRPEQYHSWMNR